MNAADTATQLRYGPPRQRLGKPIAAAVLAMVAAVAVGAGGFALLMATLVASTEGWDALGAFLLALAVGVVSGVVAYVVALVLAARWSLPPGRRVLPVVVALAAPGLLVGATAAVSSAGGHSWWAPTSVVTFLAVIACAPAAFAWAGSGRGPTLLAIGAVATLAVLTGTALTGVVVDRVADARAAAKLPLVVVEPIEAPLPGWRLDRFSATYITTAGPSFAEGEQAYLKYFTGGDVVFVRMHSAVDDCGTTVDYVCTDLGEANGGRLRRYARADGRAGYPESPAFTVLVFPDGAAVSVSEPSARAGVQPGVAFDPVQLLSRLHRVDRDAFERATGVPLRRS